jgi:hypothetical protein
VLDDLVHVGTIGVAAILGVIFIYYRRFRVLVPMAVTMFTGLTLTFGLTRLVIGHLNVITGFLVSIIAGNGINFGILYVARFLEERRRGSDLETAIKQSHLATWVGTLTAALAAAAAYGSLAVTQFHGFKHFAFIGTSGMLPLLDGDLLPRPGGADPPGPALAHPRDRDRWPQLVPALAAEDLGRTSGPSCSSCRGRPHRWRSSRWSSPAAGAVAVRPVAAGGSHRLRHAAHAERPGRRKELYRVAARAADVLGNNTESGMVGAGQHARGGARAQEGARGPAGHRAAGASSRSRASTRSRTSFRPDQQAKIPLLEEIRRKISRPAGRGASRTRTGRR